MEPSATGQQAMDRDQVTVHDWRVLQLMRLGLPGTLAKVYADRIDWHQVARLVGVRSTGQLRGRSLFAMVARKAVTGAGSGQ